MAKSTFTQAQIDALTTALASGVTTVRYADKTVTYGSISEMLRLRDRMMREVEAREGNPAPVARGSVFVRR